MSRERRNLYRLLHVQPEAPPEVIKAAWRALMSTLRAHPDLGGDPERAAQLNAAYEVLSDPERRRAYDLSLRRPARGASPAPETGRGTAGATPGAQAAKPEAPDTDLSRWMANGRCPFCQHPFAGRPGRDSRCDGCGAPLCPAPTREGGAELIGRRQAERFDREAEVDVRLPGDRRGRRARLRDLSFAGLSLLSAEPIARDQVLRVQAETFEALVRVVACRPAAVGHTVHGQLLTLHLRPGPRGVYVNAKA